VTLADPRASEILDIVARETGVARERLRPEARIDELEIASLDMVQAIFALESRFDVEIPVVTERAAGQEFATVGDLLAHVLATLGPVRA
jgi:acyl carrier protein